MKAADVLCLPSRRESFGVVIIEAASAGIPAVASRIYGITDAVADGDTGVLFEPGNIDALEDCMIEMVTRPAWRRALGESARDRVIARYPQARLTAAFLEAYARMLRRVEDPPTPDETSSMPF